MFTEAFSVASIAVLLFASSYYNFYQSAFLALISACGLMTWKQYDPRNKTAVAKTADQDVVKSAAKAAASKFNVTFLSVYCLVMASDWLQGPYVYSLYKDQFALQESTVAALFTTGFLSGGISGYFVGQFADRYGRKTACLVFCITYTTACFSILVPNLYILFLGRVFGGLSTSLMYSAFESWMVTEYHQGKLDQAGTSLSSIFGIMTTLNSIVAILAGISSEYLVELTGTRKAPFMASTGLLAIAFWIIVFTWTENYGNSHSTSTSSSPAKSTLKTVLTNKRILTLGLASCIFEGSMYLFVFFWTPALAATTSPSTSALPLGTIFATFMASVMLGSLSFNLIITSYPVLTHARLLTMIFATASASLLVTVFVKSEVVTFWSFCVFEACVGMYWPSIGYLKGRYIEDGVRARIYGLLRIPLNAFVVIALSMIKEGPEYRDLIFMACSGMLVLTSGIIQCTT